MSFSAIAALALKVGPMAIRGISSLFGGSDTADKVADIVEQSEQLLLPDNEKQSVVEAELGKLPPESLIELERVKVEMERVYNERLNIQLGDRQAEHHETQNTIRAGDAATDEYVRRTRPKGCIRSLYSGIAYIFVFEALSAFNYGDGANWEMTSFFFAPFMTYLGWRSADKKFEQKHGRPMQVSDAFNAGKSLVSKFTGARA